MKATLEIELPENCALCNLCILENGVYCEGNLKAHCAGNLKSLTKHNKFAGRAPYCPLKKIESEVVK